MSRLSLPVTERDHVRGPEGARATLVEYGDFECPHCGALHPIIESARKAFGGNLRFAFRHFPLRSSHPHALAAAKAAEAAAEQGRFWEMHDLLFAHQDELELEDLIGYAADLDLDVEQFTRALVDAHHAARVQKDVASAEASGARGTPTFFVGAHRHVGAFDTETLSRDLHFMGAPRP